MNKKSINIDRAKQTLTKILIGIALVGYLLKWYKPIYMEMALILCFLGLVMLYIMDSLRDKAEAFING